MRILIAEDDPVIAIGLVARLKALGHEPLGPATDGRHAIELARADPPDLYLFDVDMPRLDGIGACRELRAREELRETRIVMLTAGSEHEGAARAAGADLFLTKPFSPLDLLRLVDDLA